MPNPIVKAIIITISALFLCILGLFYFRQTGLSRHYNPIQAEFLKQDVNILHGGLYKKYPTHSMRALEFAKAPKQLNMISIQRTKDGHFILFPDDLLDNLTDGKGPVFLMNLDQLKKLRLKNNKGEPTDQLITLNEYILKFGSTPFVINIADQDPAKSMGLVEILKKHNLADRVIIHSPYQSNIKTMRKYLPRAVYSVNTQAVMQARVFASFFIETMAPIKGDVVISPMKMFKTQDVLTPRLLEEFQRRNIPILVESSQPLTTKQKAKYKPFGTVLTSLRK